MLPHDELYHYGVRGMRWGIRQDKVARLEARAQRHDRASEKYSNRAERKSAGKFTLSVNPVSTNPGMTKAQRVEYLKYKAEEHRLKAGQLRAKKLTGAEREKALATFTASASHKKYKNAINIYKAYMTAVTAYMLYPTFKLGFQLSKDAAYMKVGAYRNMRAKGMSSTRPKLPKISQEEALKGMKSGLSYIVNDDGTLSKAGKVLVR